MLALLLAGAPAVFASEPVGAVFLRVGVGARNAGMGDADIVGARDPSVLHWNPAGLARLARPQVLLHHNNWLADVRQEYVGGVFPLSAGGFGVGANGLYVGNIPRYVDDVPLDEPQGDFGYYALAVQGGYGREFIDGLATGVAVKAIREQIDIEGAWSFAADVGVAYATPIDGCRVAIVVANIGPPIRVGGVDADLPFEARVGAGYQRNFSNVATEVHGLFRASRGLNPRAHFGAEVGAHHVFLRGGVKFGYDLEDASFGLGAEAGRLVVDYAFVPFSEEAFGDAHRFSLTLGL
ncbi:MAG: PorV/PorQ family protein [bacterium]